METLQPSQLRQSRQPARILITGASGFVGGHLIEQCRIHFPEAQLFGLYTPGNEKEPVTWQQNIIPLSVDITQPASVQQAIAQTRPELVFHLAAQSSVAISWSDPAKTLRINAEGAINLLEALRRDYADTRVVLIGSGEQYGMVTPQQNPIREDHPMQPINPYAVSKVAQDLYGYQYFMAYHLPVLRVRAFNQFGPRQAAHFVLASFARQIALIEANKAAPELATGNLRAQRDFLPVQDAVRAYIAIADRGTPGTAYNVGSGQAHSIEEMLHLLLSLTDTPIRVYEDPARLRPIDQPLFVADTTRLRHDTDWQPSIPLKEALRQTLDYWRSVV